MAGEWDVGKIERGLTAKKFRDWEIYARLEPFNQSHMDNRFAAIAQMVFNMAVAPEHRIKELDEFTVRYKTEEEQKTEQRAPQTFEEQIAIAKIWAKTMAANPMVIEEP